MFRYFPDNYVWSGSVIMALGFGGVLDEIDQACQPLVNLAQQGDDAGTEAFLQTWSDMADRLVGFANRDEAAGHLLTAGPKHARACVYYQTAERMQRHSYKPREQAYAKSLASFDKAIRFSQDNCERVEIAYAGRAFTGLFIRALGGASKAPTMVFCNGLDSTKEMCYRSGMAQELARRGVSTLIVDQPGTGEALRLRGLHGGHDSERWASAAVDHLLTRPDVDPARIGMMGWSLGGYYAPRAAAFEKRFSLCVSWGANFNWGELQKRRLAREGDRPVPHYWEHVQWVFGHDSLESFMAFAPKMTLEGVVEQITVPYLITHGEDDRQIPLADAHLQYAAATGSPKRELKIFTRAEGGTAHVSADNQSVAACFIADWIQDHL